MRQLIEEVFDNKPEKYTPEHFALFARFKEALNAGEIRAAEPDASQPAGWRVNGWVKKGILLGFRLGSIVDMSVDPHRYRRRRVSWHSRLGTADRMNLTARRA